jgi:DNA-binding HxlR family transcriptional regulator
VDRTDPARAAAGPEAVHRDPRSHAAIGPNRLTGRLRTLHEIGVVFKTEPTPVYALTDFGEGLRVPVIGLGLWAWA